MAGEEGESDEKERILKPIAVRSPEMGANS
jgi:hypothetical protein